MKLHCVLYKVFSTVVKASFAFLTKYRHLWKADA